MNSIRLEIALSNGKKVGIKVDQIDDDSIFSTLVTMCKAVLKKIHEVNKAYLKEKEGKQNA